MPHTQGKYQQLLPNTDAIAIFGPDDIMALAAADCVLTRNAAGDYAYNVAASKTVTFALALGKLLQRTGQQSDFLEQYGTAAGVAGASSVANTGDPASFTAQGRPPFTGATQLSPRTGNVLKGVKIKSFKISYQIGAVNLIAHTCRVDKTVYANGVANAVTSVLASGANGLATAFSATPYNTAVALAAGEQIFRVTDLSFLTLEIGVQTNAGGTFRLQNIEVLYEFNFN
jgi:hypothetical protein